MADLVFPLQLVVILKNNGVKMINEFSGDNRWLSNFWLTPIISGDWVYPATENAYQALKTPKSWRHHFINCSPAMSKKMGSDWAIDEEDKLVNMKKVLDQKFHIANFNSVKLLHTGEQEIIEGNTWGDKFWGVCDGEGKNNLGLMIMDIRRQLQSR